MILQHLSNDADLWVVVLDGNYSIYNMTKTTSKCAHFNVGSGQLLRHPGTQIVAKKNCNVTFKTIL